MKKYNVEVKILKLENKEYFDKYINDEIDYYTETSENGSTYKFNIIDIEKIYKLINLLLDYNLNNESDGYITIKGNDRIISHIVKSSHDVEILKSFMIDEIFNLDSIIK